MSPSTDMRYSGFVSVCVPIRNTADFSPFGVQLDGRTIQGDFYRRGFNGMEKDDEVKGGGNSVNYDFRFYDSRISRWFCIDEFEKKYPSSSHYAFTSNNPIYFIEIDGRDHITFVKTTTQTKIVKITADRVNENVSFNSTYSIEIVKCDGPDVFSYRYDNVNQTMEQPVGSLFFEITDKSLKIGKPKKLNPWNSDSENSFTKSISNFCDGLFGEMITHNDNDAVTIGKFMLHNNNFANYIKKRHSEAEDWELYANASEWQSALSKVTQTITLCYLGSAFSSASAAETFTVNSAKFDYFFGRVVNGTNHNIERSAQNLKDLTTLGINNESELMTVFNQAYNGTIVSTKSTQYGTTVMRNINIGNKGSINVGFFYKGGNMSKTPSISTIIPKIH